MKQALRQNRVYTDERFYTNNIMYFTNRFVISIITFHEIEKIKNKNALFGIYPLSMTGN